MKGITKSTNNFRIKWSQPSSINGLSYLLIVENSHEQLGKLKRYLKRQLYQINSLFDMEVIKPQSYFPHRKAPSHHLTDNAIIHLK